VKDVELDIEPLGPLAWWTYAGVMFFAGALYVIAALIAMSAGRGSAARTFIKLAVFGSLVLFTFFDYHTTRVLAPLLWLAKPMLPMAFISLGLRLPDDVPLIESRRWIPWVLDGLGLLIAAGLMSMNALGKTAAPFEIATMALYPVGFLFLGGMVTGRFIKARGARRDLLRPLILTLVVPHAVIACGFLMHGPVKTVADMITFPTLALTPLATMVAFVRHDIWKSRTLLPRFATRAVIAAIVCILAVAFGAAIAVFFGAPFAQALLASFAGAVMAAALVILALAFGDKAFFPSLAQYKPTVEQLSEELTSIASPNEVARAVERTVRRWLRCDTIEFAFASDPEKMDVPVLTTQESGAHKISIDSPTKVDAGGLILPVLFRGVILGNLRVSQKRQGALFTSEDLDLLKTIANQGALALAHAIAYAELERRRKQQAAAWRDEREALVETLSAEIAHEIRYPINFFRTIFKRASDNRILDQEDIEIGCEEVDRLERLVSGLRRMATQHVERRVVDIAELCSRAEVLLRDRMGGHTMATDLGAGGVIRCDVDKVTQILVNLLANALDAIEEHGEVGVRWRSSPRGGELYVWDTGPGFHGDPSRFFAPWYTTKPRGTGLGLAITHRLVRAHGWNIEAGRRDSITVFVVTIPAADLVSGVDRPPTDTSSSETRQLTQGKKGEVA